MPSTAPIEASAAPARGQNGEVFPYDRGILASEQAMEPADIPLMVVSDCVVDLIEQRDGNGAFVGDLDPGPFREGHGKPDIHAGVLAA
jgi:hypothetical protein